MKNSMNIESLMHIFPNDLKRELSAIFMEHQVTEIRIRSGLPCIVCTDTQEIFLEKNGKHYIITKEELLHILQKMSQYSLFAFREELSEGFLTIEGGHRIGICGKCYQDSTGHRQIKNITSLNIRIARQVIGCANQIFPYLLEDNEFCHTLLISPPGHGKTTYLRDIIRIASDGFTTFPGRNVSVIDERSELANLFNGQKGFYLGKRTDLLDHCSKSEGIPLVIRSMAPDIIAADEIGSKNDMDAFRFSRNCGCKLLMTMHGNKLEDITEHPNLGPYLTEYPFERYVVIHREKNGDHQVHIYDKNKALLCSTLLQKETV